MKTEKWVSRTFVVAAMSATVAVPMSGAAQGMQDSAVSRNSGKAQVQSASHGTSVNGELQKLFQQSGQEMPSMRSQDLPNAQNMQSQLVRKKPAEPVKKENVFKKFWGKVTGRGTAPAAAPAPVPPDYREPAPASATAGPAGGLRRTAPQPAAAASKAAGARPAFPTIMKPAATPAGEPAAVPPVAGHSLRPRTVVSEPAAAGPAGLPVLSGKPSRFVQPGQHRPSCQKLKRPPRPQQLRLPPQRSRCHQQPVRRLMRLRSSRSFRNCSAVQRLMKLQIRWIWMRLQRR